MYVYCILEADWLSAWFYDLRQYFWLVRLKYLVADKINQSICINKCGGVNIYKKWSGYTWKTYFSYTLEIHRGNLKIVLKHSTWVKVLSYIPSLIAGPVFSSLSGCSRGRFPLAAAVEGVAAAHPAVYYWAGRAEGVAGLCDRLTFLPFIKKVLKGRLSVLFFCGVFLPPTCSMSGDKVNPKEQNKSCGPVQLRNLDWTPSKAREDLIQPRRIETLHEKERTRDDHEHHGSDARLAVCVSCCGAHYETPWHGVNEGFRLCWPSLGPSPPSASWPSRSVPTTGFTLGHTSATPLTPRRTRPRCKPRKSEATWRTLGCGGSAASKVKLFLHTMVFPGPPGVSSRLFVLRWWKDGRFDWWEGFKTFSGINADCSGCIQNFPSAFCKQSNRKIITGLYSSLCDSNLPHQECQAEFINVQSYAGRKLEINSCLFAQTLMGA